MVDKKGDDTGVLGVRGVVPAGPDLQGPRLPPWHDFIAAERRRLKVPATKGAQGWSKKEKKAWDAFARISSSDPLPSTFVYRYTRGPDLTNDEMGYGELVEEPFWVVTGNK